MVVLRRFPLPSPLHNTGRISVHANALTGAHVSGFNIDENQIDNAKWFAAKSGLTDRLDFKVGLSTAL